MLRTDLLPLFLLLSTTLTFGQMSEKTYYRTPELQQLALSTDGRSFSLYDDHMEPFTVSEYNSADGMIYWYRRIATEVCLTGDCRPIDVGIYWDFKGDFAGLEVFKEPLTKTDHSDFAAWDYGKLMSILKDDWSPLREYSLSELVDEKPVDGVDAITGATKREIAEAAVEKAVYTTHTLWHLIHVGEKEQLAKLTVEQLTQNHQLEKTLSANRAKFLPFLLDMFGQGHIPQDAFTESIVLDGLTESTDPTLRTIALNALRQLDLSTPGMQDRLAVIYKAKKQAEKVEILTRIKPVPNLSKQWYDAVSDDLNSGNPWMAVKILNTLKSSSRHSQKVIDTVGQLSRSDIPVVRKAAEEFQQARFKSN